MKVKSHYRTKNESVVLIKRQHDEETFFGKVVYSPEKIRISQSCWYKKDGTVLNDKQDVGYELVKAISEEELAKLKQVKA